MDEERMANRLTEALRGDPGIERPVNVDALVRNSESTFRRKRRHRRVAVTATGGLVIALGLGTLATVEGLYEKSGVVLQVASGTMQGSNRDDPAPTVSPTDSAANAPEPTAASPDGPEIAEATPTNEVADPAPTPTVPSGDVEPLTDPPQASELGRAESGLPRTSSDLIVVSDQAIFDAGDVEGLSQALGPISDVQLTYDSEQYVKVPTTSTSTCRDEPLGLQFAQGGRSISFQASNDGRSISLSQAVRVFTGEGAKYQISWLQQNVATCVGAWPRYDQVTEADGVSIDQVGDGAVLAYTVIGDAESRSSGQLMMVGAVRSGRSTSGFQVFLPRSDGDSAASDRQLAERAGVQLLRNGYQRLVDSRLGPDSVSDGSLI